jgi:GPH family glycoside/pentoside/hexuronide:cation symporter
MNNNEIKHSKKNMASYGFSKALVEFIGFAFTAFGFYYYESELGLDVLLVGLGYIIFAIYNAINDPLVGYLTNRPFKFTKKWGRRFPFIFIGGTLWVISYILIFTPPNVDPQSGAWVLFGWLVFTTCLFDTFASIFYVNFQSLFPDKFRSVEERRTATGIQTPIGIVGIVLGAVVPPLFITFGDIQSYIIHAVAIIIIGLILLYLSIPGCREDQITIDRYLAKHDSKSERESFFGTMKLALKQRNFVALILMYTLFMSFVICFQASLPYVVRFILKMDASAITYLSGGFLIGGILSIPIWIKLAHKLDDNRKVIIIGGMFLAIAIIPFIFLNDFTLLIIAMVILGIGLGGFWVMMAPIFADVIDESVIEMGKREEGVFNGFQEFFGVLAILIQAITFVVVHILTGFKGGASTQSAEAIWGIHIHFGLMPMIFMLLGMIIFWKWYDLTPEKVKANQIKVKELGL